MKCQWCGVLIYGDKGDRTDLCWHCGKVRNTEKEKTVANTNKKKCNGHTPTLALNLGNGVYAGSKYECKPYATNPNNFQVVLNCTGTGMFSSCSHKIPFDWGHQFEKPATNEIVLDWYNNQAVCIHPDFWLKLREFVVDNYSKVLVCCEGGHGRTGTALTALMLTGKDWKTWDAIDYLRTNYCKDAVETQVQVDYLKDLEKYFKEKK